MEKRKPEEGIDEVERTAQGTSTGRARETLAYEKKNRK